MNSVPAISLSGMKAAQTSLGVAAHNVANLATEGFRRQTVHSAATASGGVHAEVGRSATPGSLLERDVVDQLRAKTAFMANLAVFRSADAMMGSLLDVRA